MAFFAWREREQRREPSLAAAPARRGNALGAAAQRVGRPARAPGTARRGAAEDARSRPARSAPVAAARAADGAAARSRRRRSTRRRCSRTRGCSNRCSRISACAGQIVKVRPGPVVTLYELEPAPGIKASRIIGLADDIARSMSAISARVAVVPGRNVIGIELPNAKAETVYLRELLASEAYERTQGAARPRARQGHRRRPRRRRSRRACRISSSPAPPAPANRSASTP